ncbi:HNH endonuclease [Cupriavidus sp. TKC]|nr:HNH endonuclease [Cupriavidus sp. TKC]GMG90676.1 HNH endonuclease [Cupriavidus sp. TKC]
MARLTKQQREDVRQMFSGRCAYCGEPLPERWHVDHVEPVMRAVVPTKTDEGWRLRSGPMLMPERDIQANYMPACPPCNIDKHAMTLDGWRAKLQRSCEVLAKNLPTYRHALRFGLVQETQASVTFYFERARATEGESNG